MKFSLLAVIAVLMAFASRPVAAEDPDEQLDLWTNAIVGTTFPLSFNTTNQNVWGGGGGPSVNYSTRTSTSSPP